MVPVKIMSLLTVMPISNIRRLKKYIQKCINIVRNIESQNHFYYVFGY